MVAQKPAIFGSPKCSEVSVAVQLSCIGLLKVTRTQQVRTVLHVSCDFPVTS